MKLNRNFDDVQSIKMKAKSTLLFIIVMATTTYSGNSALLPEKGKEPASVKIGQQIWTATNCDTPMMNSFYYDKDSVANHGDGRLYFFSSAMAACPKGWHVPSDAEWQTMIDYLGGDSLAVKALLPGGKSGLNLTYAGYRSANSPNDLFGKKGETGFYWTSTVKAEQIAYGRSIDVKTGKITVMPYRRANAFSVRFVKDAE